MKRNTFINQVSLGIGSAVLLPSVTLLQGCEYKPTLRTTLSESDILFLDEIGETIIPTTANSAGAKASQIGNYMHTMYLDCMPRKHQTIFLNGLNVIDERSSKKFSSSFLDASPAQKFQLLESMQTESAAYHLKMEDAKIPVPHYFDLLKGMTLRGYYTSEIGMTQARRYLPIPGKFMNCIDYQKTDLPWAM